MKQQVRVLKVTFQKPVHQVYTSLYIASRYVSVLDESQILISNEIDCCLFVYISISRMPAATGISHGALKIIKKMVDSMNEREKLCILCMDEVSLKTNLFYDRTKDMIVGL